jgi:hypothetical protein
MEDIPIKVSKQKMNARVGGVSIGCELGSPF